VVGHAVDQDGSAAGTIAFITDLFEVVAIGSARAALNGALDVVLGHVGRGGLVPGQAQTRVGVRVGAAGACRNGDFTDDLGPELAALGVLTPFAVLDVCPFTVSGHICSTKSESWEFYPQASLHHMKTRQTPFRGAFFAPNAVKMRAKQARETRCDAGSARTRCRGLELHLRPLCPISSRGSKRWLSRSSWRRGQRPQQCCCRGMPTAMAVSRARRVPARR